VNPGALDLLRSLKTHGIKTGIVSNAQRVFFEDEIRTTGLLAYLDSIVISADYKFQKPDTRLFALALDMVGAKADEAVFVGDDMLSDILGAKNAGIQAVYIPSKYGVNFARNISPDHFARELSGVRELFGIA